jgi:undecaprenyl-diphosphatase
VLFAGLVVIATCCTQSRTVRRLAVLLAVIAAPLVGFARVYRGLHHPSDVIVGMLFGIGCLIAAAIAVRAASVAYERQHAASRT